MNPQTPHTSADPVKEPPADSSSPTSQPFAEPVKAVPEPSTSDTPPEAPAPKPQVPAGAKSPMMAITIAIVLFVVLAGVAFYAYTSAN